MSRKQEPSYGSRVSILKAATGRFALAGKRRHSASLGSNEAQRNRISRPWLDYLLLALQPPCAMYCFDELCAGCEYLPVFGAAVS